MSFRQRPATPLGEVLQRDDEQIKAYMRFICTSDPKTANEIKTQLEECLASANQALINGEDMVTNGLAGGPASREEAIRRLHGWADGTMQQYAVQQTAIINKQMKQIKNFRAMRSTAAQPEPASAESKEDEQEQNPEQDNFFNMMKQIGTMYIAAETSKRKIDLALAELSQLEAQPEAEPSTCVLM